MLHTAVAACTCARFIEYIESADSPLVQTPTNSESAGFTWLHTRSAANLDRERGLVFEYFMNMHKAKPKAKIVLENIGSDNRTTE